METAKLKKFAQFARRSLLEQVSAKLKLVLAENSAARRESTEAIKKLEEVIKGHGKEQVIERVAYIWFNRFCALRFMDVNRYNRVNIVSPADPGQFQPEILAEAKMGHIDEEMVHDKVRQQIFALLDGKAPSRDPQGEAYRLLVVAACNSWNKAMPFLFQRIDDYTELLMPDDLLSGNSILAYTREAMTPDACGAEPVGSGKWIVDSNSDSSHSPLSTLHSNAGGVEVIGWLYQFYISEKKDEVFDGLKKNKKVTPENIPAATQLFTPHWIVKYLVENSLGRLWMLNRPNSRLADRMEYYIRPETSVGSEKWEVKSKENKDGSAELSGVDRLAESDGLGRVGLSGNQGISEGGTLRTDQSGSKGSSIDSLQYSGGASASIDSGVQKLSIDSSGFESGSGNANYDSSAAPLHIPATDRSNSGTIRGNQADDVLINRETEITSHSSLPTSHLRISSPEEIRICDPACGSGHMLTYAFDLLYAIYEEEGYEPAEIPEKILTNNLYGIEIDERAGELAAFALTMKARSRSRRFFRKAVKPNICVLEKVKFDDGELAAVGSEKWVVGSEKQQALHHDLHLFEEADNFGSLLRPQLPLEDIEALQNTIHSTLSTSHSLFDSMTHQKVLQALRQADYLSPKYHVVIANPPYMGGKGMNGRLAAWAKDNFPNSKSDLFAMFIERNLDLAQMHGVVAMITMQSWMFLSSFEALRTRLLGQNTLLSMAHLGARAFDSIGGEVVSTTAFVLENANRLDFKGSYLRLVSGNSEIEKNDAIREAVRDPDCGWLFRSSAADFKKIPGSPIAYWVSSRMRNCFESMPEIRDIEIFRRGIATGDNALFLRYWFEVGTDNSFVCKEPTEAKWVKCNKGGEFRKWFGNLEHVINWEDGGRDILNFKDEKGKLRSRPQNIEYNFKPVITYSSLTSGTLSVRFFDEKLINDQSGNFLSLENIELLWMLSSFLNCKLTQRFLDLLNPTMNVLVEDLNKLPFDRTIVTRATLETFKRLHSWAKNDWDSYETSWDFTGLQLLNPDYRQQTLKATYQKLRAHWREMTLEMQRLEEENNRIFIEAYGLQDELNEKVDLNEITLTCNPHYRYGNDKSEDELEALLLADTMRELVSYAVGCMFGRYALEKPGLILANQGETIEDYLKRVPEPSFPADDDNVIPMLDGDWFTDDIAERFRKFLRVAFGEEHYEANLQFVEKALGKNGKARDIRDYFLKDFYTDHVKRYKKRPIYWLFSSPKGSFNALIYMHRYRPDTVSVVLNDYLREFRTKLTSHKNHLEAVSISASSSQGEKTKALKEIEKITKMIAEMEEYEREVLYPLATEQVEIDLDEGVKVNYPKFGAALKKIVGLDAKED